MTEKKKADPYGTTTNTIVEAIEVGAGDCAMPWHRQGGDPWMPANALTGRTYSGVNVVSLWATAEAKGYGSGVWATYKQWQALDAQVRKGQKGTPVVFYKEFRRDLVDGATGEVTEKRSLVARTSHVFNLCQVDGYVPAEVPKRNLVERVDAADAFVAATRADIRHGGDRACYHPKGDYIAMPDRDRFTGTRTSTPTEAYHAVLFHELTQNAEPRIMPRRLLYFGCFLSFRRGLSA